LRASIDAAAGTDERLALQTRLNELEQMLALRLEALRIYSST